MNHDATHISDDSMIPSQGSQSLPLSGGQCPWARQNYGVTCTYLAAKLLDAFQDPFHLPIAGDIQSVSVELS